MKISELMQSKSKEVWSISPEATVYEALEYMASKSVGALAVAIDGELVGMLSERDYARKVILSGKSSKDTIVKDIMTSHVFYTSLEEDMESCLAKMNKHRIRHMPVVEDGKLVGMISIGDVVKQIISDQQYTIQQLENYISWEESY